MELAVTKSTAVGEDQRGIITLAGAATIGEVDRIKAALLDAFIECRELVLNVREVTAADPALLQLIHSARQTALRAGIRFSLAGEFSTAFHKAVVSAGFLSEDNNENESA